MRLATSDTRIGARVCSFRPASDDIGMAEWGTNFCAMSAKGLRGYSRKEELTRWARAAEERGQGAFKSRSRLAIERLQGAL
jgi:hypothetical protein